MSYRNAAELIEFLKKERLRTKKRLGQNFLINRQVLEKIAETADLTKKDFIVEVGPGVGILTAELAARAGHVISVELDEGLIPALKKNLADFGNVEIVHGDALKFPLPQKPYKLVANIPYYITSPILNHFLQPKEPQQRRPSLIVLLVQKEVAEKICAGRGDHTVLSLQVQVFGKPSIAGAVGRSSFFPQPEVDSAILKIETYPQPLIKNTGLFFRVIKAAFAQRRKTLSNSMRSGLKLEKNDLEKILSETDIANTARPQELTIDQWSTLLRVLEKYL